METLVFALLSLFMFAGGWLVIIKPDTAARLLLWGLAIIPTGTIYGGFIRASGVMFYDFFMVGGLLSLFVLYLTRRYAITRFGFLTCLVYLVWIAYFVVGFTKLGMEARDLYDVRPLLSFAMALLLLALAQRKLVNLNVDELYLIVTVAGLFNIALFAAQLLGLIPVTDAWFENNAFRYMDSRTYLCAFFVLQFIAWMFEGKIKLGGKPGMAFWIAIACVLVSNSRTMILALCLSFFVLNPKKVKYLFYAGFFAVVLLLVFLQISIMLGAERVISALDPEQLFVQMSVRFGPAILKILEMDTLQYITGLGPGTKFYIPWFEYRGLETDNYVIDSSYFTFYVKYGLFGFFLLFYNVALFVKGTKNVVRRTGALFLLTMFVVSSIPYLPYFFGYMAPALLFGACEPGQNDRVSNQNA